MSENNQSKRSRCRYCFPSIRKNGNEFHCVVDGWENENVKNVSCKDCESCSKFSSRYFVPELKRIVYGYESWWREIESADDFAGISDEDIENTWYVGLLKKLKE